MAFTERDFNPLKTFYSAITYISHRPQPEYIGTSLQCVKCSGRVYESCKNYTSLFNTHLTINTIIIIIILKQTHSMPYFDFLNLPLVSAVCVDEQRHL